LRCYKSERLGIVMVLLQYIIKDFDYI
jgi:hypothetical protein